MSWWRELCATFGGLPSLRSGYIIQHIRCGLTSLPFETLLSSVATSYTLGMLYYELRLPSPGRLSHSTPQTARGCSAMRAAGCCIVFSSSDSPSMPLFFASSALMPYDKMPEWLRMLAMVNPLSHTIDSIRELFMGGIPVEGMVGLAVAAGVMVCVGVVQFRRTGV